MIIRGQLHDNSCKKKWFEQLCAISVLCVKNLFRENLKTHKPKNLQTKTQELK